MMAIVPCYMRRGRRFTGVAQFSETAYVHSTMNKEG
jgi:hypothetical protein